MFVVIAGHTFTLMQHCNKLFLLRLSFLADRIKGRAYGTLLCSSVVSNVCIVVERYVLQQNCPKKQNYAVARPLRCGHFSEFGPTPYITSIPRTGILTAPPNMCFFKISAKLY